jgi:hypothetical protein
MRVHTGKFAAVSATALLVLLLAPSAGAGSLPPVGSPQLIHPGAWASFDTGHVNVVLPTQLPRVELYQDSNRSVSATLQVDQVLEMSPGALPHPTVVAAAFPSGVQGFNGSANGTASTWPLTLSAELEVRPQNVSLWSNAPALLPVGGSIGEAILQVEYAPIDNGSGSGGVWVSWSITDWPWVNPGDLLAVELQFTVGSGRTLTACTGSHPLDPDAPGCVGQPIPSQGISWGSNFNSLEGSNGTGPMASVAWNESAQLPTGAVAPYTVGTLSTGNGSAELLLGAAGLGSDSVVGGVSFSLVAAPLQNAPLVGIVGGIGWVYLGTLLGTGLLASGGVVAYRRRDRRMREDL